MSSRCMGTLAVVLPLIGCLVAYLVRIGRVGYRGVSPLCVATNMEDALLAGSVEVVISMIVLVFMPNMHRASCSFIKLFVPSACLLYVRDVVKIRFSVLLEISLSLLGWMRLTRFRTALFRL